MCIGHGTEKHPSQFASPEGRQEGYEKGVRVAKKGFRKIEKRLQRDETLPKYSVGIQPEGVALVV